MGVEPPFLYDAVKKDTTRYSYKEFDPKAVSRASMQSQPQKPKKDGPLVSFNKHPDSYLIMPSGKATGARVSASMKGRITETRMAVLFFRIFQLLGAIGALTTMVLITGVDNQMGWIMRIVPGISMLHTSYGIYHLSRKPSGRTPGSSASYMLFASLCDASIMAFYAFSTTTAYYQWDPKDGLWESTNSVSAWTTWPKLQEGGPYVMKTLLFSAFLCFGVSAIFHFITLLLSIWLFILFRKIVNLPPDMNPLESNLTSRAHKRNKSSVSTMSIYDDKRTSTQSVARSGDPYEGLSQPPTMPFMQTRNNSGSSFSTYYSIPTSASPRDSRLDLPSRQYQIPSTDSPRTSVADLKRTSQSSLPSVSPKRGSYTPVATQDLADQYADTQNENWYSTDSLPRNRRSQPPSPVKSARSPAKNRPQSAYTPLRDGFGTYEDINDADFDSDVGTSTVSANPLSAHPVDPRMSQPLRAPALNRESALGEISLNRSNTAGSSSYSRDVGDISGPQRGYYDEAAVGHADPRGESEYRELTPQPLVRPGAAGKGIVGHSSDRDGIVKGSVGFKARYYGELRAGTPPTLVGGVKGRQVSSGIDIGVPTGDERRDVSGKIAEEGRGGGWGARFRKISGI
ncbi:hypothetical protein V493_02652 [Pseudogymnoascus sp. VKM F-4281 (FW-2241)]|nr:hypothetical protein V493_02652 [Pseudogymnoascus sp. VKM F-4281 (FW-2241)]